MKFSVLLMLGATLYGIALVLPSDTISACENGCQEHDCYKSGAGTCVHYDSSQCAYLSAGNVGMKQGNKCSAVSPAVDVGVQVCTSCTQDCATASGFGQASGCSDCSGGSVVPQTKCDFKD